MNNELVALGVQDIISGLAQKKFSSTELVTTLLNRISATHKKFNAFLEVPREQALKAAAQADSELKSGSKKPLLGVPIAIKDAIVTEGVTTTAGSKILKNFVPPYSATVIKKLEAAGAIVIGKTNMDEFAMGSSNEHSAFGPVTNPWDTARVPGGSSGGSACAVAGCLAPASLGSDTGGSIRQPAALCNIVGLKPTYGRVSRYGLIAFASSLDQIGPFTRTVKDAALITEVLCGHDTFDATSASVSVPKFSESVGKTVAGLRVGVPKEYFIGGLSPEVDAATKKSLDVLKSLGAEIVEISLPHTEAAVAVYYIIAPAEASSNLARFDGVRYGHRAEDAHDLREMYARTRSEGFGSEVQRRIMVGTYVLSSGYFDAYYVRAQKVRTLITKDFTDAFASKCDVIACPVTPTTAFKIGEKSNDPLAMYLSDVFTIPVNLAGLPGISVPCGFDTAGLPIGLQFIGKAFDEETLFRVAGAYEAATEWHTRLPKLDN